MNLFVLFNGTAAADVLFDHPADCPSVRSAGACAVEDTLVPLDCTTTRAEFPHAGVITVSSGSASTDLAPDELGLYRQKSLVGVTAGMPLHVHAAGGEVPAFDVDVTIPDAIFALAAPVRGTVVPRTSPLSVAWTATGEAPLSNVRVIGQDAESTSESILCSFPSPPLDAEVPTALLSDFNPTARSFVSLKPAWVTTTHLAGWDIDVLAEGAFDLAEVSFAP